MRLLAVGLLLLAGCNRQEDAPALSAKVKDSMAQAPIIERQAVANSMTPPPSPAPFAPPGSNAGSAMKAAPPSSETRYRAVGTEPFWAVTVKGSTMTLERPSRPPLSLAIARTDDGRAIRYLGDGFAMVVTEGPCSDGMSDAIWADRVSLSFGGGTLKGCGGVREDF